MLKNVQVRGTAILLAALLFLTSFFGPGTKSVHAAVVAPAIIALWLIAGSIVSHLKLEMNPETFRGMRENLPPNTFRGPHRIPVADTYWCENTDGEQQIWDKQKEKWLPKTEWEKLYNHGREIECRIPTM